MLSLNHLSTSLQVDLQTWRNPYRNLKRKRENVHNMWCKCVMRKVLRMVSFSFFYSNFSLFLLSVRLLGPPRKFTSPICMYELDLSKSVKK